MTVTGVIPPAAGVFRDGGERVKAHADPNCVMVCVNPCTEIVPTRVLTPGFG